MVRLQLSDFLDLAFKSHIRLLQVLDVLVLHLVHVDHLQDLSVVSKCHSVSGSNFVHQRLRPWQMSNSRMPVVVPLLVLIFEICSGQILFFVKLIAAGSGLVLGWGSGGFGFQLFFLEFNI